MPERIANAPILKQGLQFYLNAFFELDTDRTHNWGLTPIPWSSINRYVVAFDLDDEEAENLYYVVRQLDNAHLQRLEAKSGGTS